MLMTSSSTAGIEVEVTATTTASTTSKEARENVVKVHVVELLPAIRVTLALFVLADSFFALLIIDPPFLLIRERLVGIRDLLEFLLGGLWVVLILVWMVLNGKLLESLLDLGF